MKNIIQAIGTGLLAASLFLVFALVWTAVIDQPVNAYHQRVVRYTPPGPHAYRDRYKHVDYEKPLPYVEVQAANVHEARAALRKLGGPVRHVIREGFGKHPLRVFRTEADYTLYRKQNASIFGV